MFTDVMVDIETTGNNFERNAIIQIAGVKFNYETGEVCDDFFDRCLRVHPGREWDLDTRQWWMKQGNVLQTIEARMEDPYTVLKDFQQWLLQDWPSDRPEGRQMWAKPTHYEKPYLDSYFKMFGLDMPCHFRYCRDLNSFIAGLRGDPSHAKYEDELAVDGPEHNALFDVLHQIKVLFHAKNQTVRGEVLA